VTLIEFGFETPLDRGYLHWRPSSSKMTLEGAGAIPPFSINQEKISWGGLHDVVFA
jgi:hypothetical protein